MSWQDLISTPDDTVTVPWTGGREIRAGGRHLKLKGKAPEEYGWHTFSVSGGREARWKEAAEINPSDYFAGTKTKIVRGYLVGDRVIPDSATASVDDPTRIVEQAEPVFLLEPGMERFARVAVARYEDGRLIYVGQEFPLGPEQAVTEAYQDRKDTVTDIPNVTPALDLAFRFERWARAEAERIREENARLAREEEARQAQAERRAALANQLGTGEGRRAMAAVDFGAAARAALVVGGAELLDWRDSRTPGEAVVQFRFKERRYECVCQKQSLRIVDSGICLVDHNTNVRGDTWFTLESLPGVIAEAIRERKLVVFRHADDRGIDLNNRNDYHDREDEDDDW